MFSKKEESGIRPIYIVLTLSMRQVLIFGQWILLLFAESDTSAKPWKLPWACLTMVAISNHFFNLLIDTQLVSELKFWSWATCLSDSFRMVIVTTIPKLGTVHQGKGGPTNERESGEAHGQGVHHSTLPSSLIASPRCSNWRGELCQKVSRARWESGTGISWKSGQAASLGYFYPQESRPQHWAKTQSLILPWAYLH